MKLEHVVTVLTLYIRTAFMQKENEKKKKNEKIQLWQRILITTIVHRKSSV